MSGTGGSSKKSRKRTILLDRCVPPAVGEALLHFGYDYQTLDEVYGDGSLVPDVQWIKDSGLSRIVVLTQNYKIFTVSHEAEAIRRYDARVLSYHRASLTKEAKSMILGRHLRTLDRLHDHSGPAFWRVRPLDPLLRDI